MIKVSIIIPVYNVENYLSKCLSSCVNQTLDEIEIIVINDASPDASDEIMRKFQDQYPEKITNVFLEKNLRQGGARNKGIRIAKGEYLCFVDGDDYIAHDACEKLYEFAKEKDLDIACCDGYIVKDGVFYYQEQLKKWDMLSNQSLKNFTSQCYMIIKKNIILDNNLFYPEHIFHEDTSVAPLWYICANKRDILNEPLFYINKHRDSSSSSTKGIDNIQILCAMEELVINSKKIRQYNENSAAIDSFIFGRILILVNSIMSKRIEFSDREWAILNPKITEWGKYVFDETFFYRFFTKKEYTVGKQFLTGKINKLNIEGTLQNSIEDLNIYYDKSGKMKELLEYVCDRLKKTMIVWGAGAKGISIIRTIKDMGYDYIVGDNNSNLWGKKIITGDIVRGYNWIKKNIKNPIYIVTVKPYFKSICKGLSVEESKAIDIITFMEHGLNVEEYFGLTRDKKV